MLRLSFAVAATALLWSLGTTVSANDTATSSPGATEPSTPAEVYGQGVRSTAWRSPQDELAGFHLPPRFEVRLFASEPNISKPLNMAFDRRGRMWVTHSVEYPYPAKDASAARDAVSILEDRDGDGAADQFTTFADGLNVPIGVLPYGEGCLCFSIPNLWYLRDTDGDGTCDRRDVVLGPFDTTRDTHGMINSLRDGGDGWIYACHGFNNQSQVAGTDGHVVTMHSGNTFRFRPDGSRVEHVSFGQVNPFGMTEDEWGYRYTADCHSKPITQVIRGACYPSFGRPHDGLGFLPPMVDHLHGSTAISGIHFFSPTNPIVPLRGQFISGNVMTSRLNRNERIFDGATAKGKELADFLTSDDPWFRPVDIQQGPQGHLYVADFYNKIIGHYEVPLDHPGRDRTSGRIWQIRYLDQQATAVPKKGDERSPVETAMSDGSPDSRIRALESLATSGQATGEVIAAFLSDASPQIRVAGLRIGGELADQLSIDLLEVARELLGDSNAHVARSAAELVGARGEDRDVRLLRSKLADVSPTDHVLRQTIRIAIRDLLRRAPSGSPVWSRAVDAPLAAIMTGLQRPEAAAALLRYLSAHRDVSNRDVLLAHAAKHSDGNSLAQCVRVARQLTAGDPKKQFQLLDVLCTAQNARPDHVPEPLRQWALTLVESQLASVRSSERIIGWTTDDGGIWPLESRRSSDGADTMMASSFGRGEKYTGRWISDEFPAPDSITFWIAGHNGYPDQDDHHKNAVQLVLESTAEPIKRVTPPRNDTARRIIWDTSSVKGQNVRIECIDGDSGKAYAWLAVGRFSPDWLQNSPDAKALTNSLQWIRRLGLSERSDELLDMLQHRSLSRRVRILLAQTIASLRAQPGLVTVLRYLQETDAPDDLTNAALASLHSADGSVDDEPLKNLCKRMSSQQQRQFVIDWASAGANMSRLVQLAETGWISPHVLVDPTATQTIRPRIDRALSDRIDALTDGIEVDSQKSQLLASLQKAFASRSPDLQRGHRLFTQHCAACHQLRGEGNVVGPQLDGAATRSAARLLEDVVAPDRNVDKAFRTTSFLLDDGRVLVGLVTAETEREITFTAPDGKSTTIDADSIEQRRDAGRSLMPGNISETLSADDLGDLISFVRGGSS